MKQPDYRWQTATLPETGLVETLSQQLNIDTSLAQVLVQRGIHSYAEAEQYFTPKWANLYDPFNLLNMDAAVARVVQAIDNQESIRVFGDYDVDGTTAVALLSHVFASQGIAHSYDLPDRATEGYGLSKVGVERAAESGARLLITVDCGIKDVESIAHARALGLDVIVCDHHLPGNELPDAIVLNPKQAGCPYPNKELTGCAVGFKLLQALDAAQNWEYDFTQVLDLVTLSLACDLVPIVGENRTLVWHGLRKLRENPLPGIAAMMRQNSLLANGSHARRWDVSDLVFYLGPRINAAGRLHHARHAVALLLGQAETEMSTNEAQASFLETANEERRAMERVLYKQAEQQALAIEDLETRRSLVLHDAGWHKGLVGIVASKIVERFYKPAILLTQSDGYWAGSARSVEGFDLYEALYACREHLFQFGGHRFAAGLKVAQEHLDAFIEMFDAVCVKSLAEADRNPILPIDAAVRLSQLTPKFIRVLQRMEPFGPGNMNPVFLSSGLTLSRLQVLQERHLKLRVLQNGIAQDAIGFGLAHKADMLRLAHKEKQPIRIAFHPSFNQYNDQTSIQLVLKDVQVETATTE